MNISLNDKRKRVCIVVSNVDKVIAFEMLCEGIDKKRFALEFILLNPGPSYLDEYFQRNFVPYRRILLRGRIDYLHIFPRLLWQFLRERPDVVNSHLIDASLLALPAAWLARIRSRVLTRHHSTFHHEFARRWVTVDRALTFLATRVIAVSPLVKKILVDREGAPADKISVVEHGFDLDQFREISLERIQAVREKYRLAEGGPIIGVIARFIKWKGVQHIIQAFKKLLESHPNAILCLANAIGPDELWLKEKLREVSEKNLRLITFEPDHYALFKTFDIFVHTPINEHCEAFGQVYVEALAAGLPCVFTLSGIATGLVKDAENAISVPYENSNAIYKAMLNILTTDEIANNLRKEAVASVQRFGIREMIKKLELVYSD